MEISKIHSFLTYPAKSMDDKPKIRGAEVFDGNKLHEMLSEVFSKSDKECNIDISFNPEEGNQKNYCRSLILEYIESPTIPNGRKIAETLQNVTTYRSGMGLLFLMTASDSTKKSILLSRFPADIGVLAEETGSQLNVEFAEKVFMKNANAYKSAIYTGKSIKTGFWDGKATDKQITNSDVSISDYWVRKFLLSDFRTTPEAGTRRVAVAMRNAIRTTNDMLVKNQIASSTQLIGSLPAKNTSISEICSRFNFSEDTREAIYNQLPNRESSKENFVFSSEEFHKHIQYRSIELDNGGHLIAESSNFDNVFEITKYENSDSVDIRTQGVIIDERLRKTR